MDDLIEALQIFAKYKKEKWPTHCEHDTLHVMAIGRDELSEDDAARVGELGFLWSDEDDGYISFRFGSA